MKKYKIYMFAAMVAAVLSACTPSGQSQQTGAAQTVQETQTEAEKKEDINLETVHEAVKNAYGENYIPSMEYDAQMLKEVFGIDSSLYDECIAEGPMMSVHVDVFIAVRGKEGKGEEIEKILNAYREKLISDSVQYPINLPKIQSSSVERYGDDVYFVMLGSPSEQAEMQGEAEALKSAVESNQIALDIIAGYYK